MVSSQVAIIAELFVYCPIQLLQLLVEDSFVHFPAVSFGSLSPQSKSQAQILQTFSHREQVPSQDTIHLYKAQH